MTYCPLCGDGDGLGMMRWVLDDDGSYVDMPYPCPHHTSWWVRLIHRLFGDWLRPGWWTGGYYFPVVQSEAEDDDEE